MPSVSHGNSTSPPQSSQDVLIAPNQHDTSDSEYSLSPDLLQAGWLKFFCRRENMPYFNNILTKESLWELPKARTESFYEELRMNINNILNSTPKETVNGIIDSILEAGFESLLDLQFLEEDDLMITLKPIPRRKLIKAWNKSRMKEIDEKCECEKRKDEDVRRQINEILAEGKKSFVSVTNPVTLESLLEVNICRILKSVNEGTLKNVINALKSVGLECILDLSFVQEIDLKHVLKPIHRRKLLKVWSQQDILPLLSSASSVFNVAFDRNINKDFNSASNLSSSNLNSNMLDMPIFAHGQASVISEDVNTLELPSKNFCPSVDHTTSHFPPKPPPTVSTLTDGSLIPDCSPEALGMIPGVSIPTDGPWSPESSFEASSLTPGVSTPSDGPLASEVPSFTPGVSTLSDDPLASEAPNLTPAVSAHSDGLLFPELSSEDKFVFSSSASHFDPSPLKSQRIVTNSSLKHKSRKKIEKKLKRKWSWEKRYTLLQTYIKYKRELDAANKDEQVNVWNKIAEEVKEKHSFDYDAMECCCKVDGLRSNYERIKNKTLVNQHARTFVYEARKVFEDVENSENNVLDMETEASASNSDTLVSSIISTSNTSSALKDAQPNFTSITDLNISSEMDQDQLITQDQQSEDDKQSEAEKPSIEVDHLSSSEVYQSINEDDQDLKSPMLLLISASKPIHETRAKESSECYPQEIFDEISVLAIKEEPRKDAPSNFTSITDLNISSEMDQDQQITQDQQSYNNKHFELHNPSSDVDQLSSSEVYQSINEDFQDIKSPTLLLMSTSKPIHETRTEESTECYPQSIFDEISVLAIKEEPRKDIQSDFTSIHDLSTSSKTDQDQQISQDQQSRDDKHSDVHNPSNDVDQHSSSEVYQSINEDYQDIKSPMLLLMSACKPVYETRAKDCIECFPQVIKGNYDEITELDINEEPRVDGSDLTVTSVQSSISSTPSSSSIMVKTPVNVVKVPGEKLSKEDAPSSQATSSTSSNTVMQDPNVMEQEVASQDHLNELMKMGYSRSLATEALLHNDSLQQAIDYLLSYPSPSQGLSSGNVGKFIDKDACQSNSEKALKERSPQKKSAKRKRRDKQNVVESGSFNVSPSTADSSIPDSFVPADKQASMRSCNMDTSGPPPKKSCASVEPLPEVFSPTSADERYSSSITETQSKQMESGSPSRSPESDDEVIILPTPPKPKPEEVVISDDEENVKVHCQAKFSRSKTKSSITSSKNSSAQFKRRPFQWTKKRCYTLLQICTKYKAAFSRPIAEIHSDIWRKISHDFRQKSPSSNCDELQCKNKVQSLQHNYQELKRRKNIMRIALREDENLFLKIAKEIFEATENSNSSAQFKRRPFQWTKKGCYTLLQICTKYKAAFSRPIAEIHSDIWRKISHDFRQKCPSSNYCDELQCKNKVQSLQQNYQELKRRKYIMKIALREDENLILNSAKEIFEATENSNFYSNILPSSNTNTTNSDSFMFAERQTSATSNHMNAFEYPAKECSPGNAIFTEQLCNPFTSGPSLEVPRYTDQFYPPLPRDPPPADQFCAPLPPEPHPEDPRFSPNKPDAPPEIPSLTSTDGRRILPVKLNNLPLQWKNKKVLILLQSYRKHKKGLLCRDPRKQSEAWREISNEVRQKCFLNCDESDCKDKIEDLKAEYQVLKRRKYMLKNALDEKETNFFNEAKNAFEISENSDSFPSTSSSNDVNSSIPDSSSLAQRQDSVESNCVNVSQAFPNKSDMYIPPICVPLPSKILPGVSKPASIYDNIPPNKIYRAIFNGNSKWVIEDAIRLLQMYAVYKTELSCCREEDKHKVWENFAEEVLRIKYKKRKRKRVLPFITGPECMQEIKVLRDHYHAHKHKFLAGNVRKLFDAANEAFEDTGNSELSSSECFLSFTWTFKKCLSLLRLYLKYRVKLASALLKDFTWMEIAHEVGLSRTQFDAKQCCYQIQNMKCEYETKKDTFSPELYAPMQSVTFDVAEIAFEKIQIAKEFSHLFKFPGQSDLESWCMSECDRKRLLQVYKTFKRHPPFQNFSAASQFFWDNVSRVLMEKCSTFYGKRQCCYEMYEFKKLYENGKNDNLENRKPSQSFDELRKIFDSTR